MTDASQYFHGSDLEKISAHYHIDKNEIKNFSGNVNPLGLPTNIFKELSRHIELIASYPDREYTSLRQALATYCNTDSKHILVGNGSTELISLFIKQVQPKKAYIIGPTYSEYEREIFLNGGSSRYFPLYEEDQFAVNVNKLKDLLTDDTDLLVICNPNNPTSSVIDKESLRKILDDCLQKDIHVLIDETYIEFTTDVERYTAVSLADFYHNLFIIRGVSKFFAAPGLRLGYGISGNMELINQINNLKNPWTINSLASYAGELMVQDEGYIEGTRSMIDSERKRILDILSGWPEVKAFPAYANFILLKLINGKKSYEIFEALIAKKIMVRDASSFPFLGNEYIRFCILKPEDNDLLLEALREVL